MPYKPKRPCSYSGCSRLTDGRYCEEHRQIAEHHYNKYQRDPDTSQRYGRSWRRIRELYIQAHPICERCQSEGRLTPAEEVHHIVPLTAGGTNDAGNLMALCKSCHSRITVAGSNRQRSE